MAKKKKKILGSGGSSLSLSLSLSLSPLLLEFFGAWLRYIILSEDNSYKNFRGIYTYIIWHEEGGGS